MDTLGTSALLFTLVTLLTGCNMDGDPKKDGVNSTSGAGGTAGSPQVKNDFFLEYAGRTHALSGGFVNISEDGAISFQRTINPHCIQSFNGRIELISSAPGDAYKIMYRYTTFNTNHRSCQNAASSGCAANYRQCEDAQKTANQELAKLKTQTVRRGGRGTPAFVP